MNLLRTSLFVILIGITACSEKPQEAINASQLSPTIDTQPTLVAISTDSIITKPIIAAKDETNHSPSFSATILDRIQAPNNYQRTTSSPNSYATYLRTLPLKPIGAEVKYYNGTSKPNNNVYHSVVDLPIGRKDLHQCADAVMRLRAEYLWSQQQFDKIHFNFTNGFRVDYTEWRKGRKIVVNGNKVTWSNGDKPATSYREFWKYLEQIFSYAGTASLAKELQKVTINQAEIGDVLIQGGYPGHAVLIVDKVVHQQTGASLFLLAQSYMPAQEIQILKNPSMPSRSPWYQLQEGIIETPEWTFNSNDLKRFEE